MKGAKKPAAPAAKKHKHEPAPVAGAGIMKFFDKQQQEAQLHASAAPPQQHAREETPARQLPTRAADDRSPPSGALPAAGPRPALHKHLAALQDLAPADSFAMSQDTDAMQVVWQESPGASSQPLGRTLSNLGRCGAGGGAAAAAAPPGLGLGAQEFSAIKQRLISAAQKPRDVRRPGGPVLASAAAGARMQQQSEQLLEGLLARQQPAGGAAAAQQQQQAQALQREHSGMSSAPSGDLSSGAAAGSHRTPAAHLRSILKLRPGGPGGSGGRRTPASSVKFSLADSGGKGGRSARGARGSGAHPASSGKKRQAGQKRKALLELLEQVEAAVSSGASPEPEDEQQQQQQQQQQQAPGVDAGAASDKENAAGTKGGGKGEPTGSQQLMPPPGGVRYCGHGHAQAQVARQQQASQLVPPAQPPQATAQQQCPQPAQQPAQQQQQQQQPAVDEFDDDDDEGDAMLTQLELELVSKVERQHAERQAAAAAAAAGRQAGARAAPTRPARASMQAAPGRPAPTVQAAPARLQAAPPVAQHPAQHPAQQQQHQQQQPADQPLALPRSPYDKGLRGAPPPAGPEAAGAVAAPKPAAASEGGGDGWEDDDEDWGDGGMDLVAQLEAAALQERAQRSLQGEPSTSAPQTTQGDGRPPPGGAAPAAPLYAGQREEVFYEVVAVFDQPTEQVLLLRNTYQNRDVYAHLHAPWCDLPIRVGDKANVLAQLDFFEGHWHCLLGMEQGLLVLHPDVLLSGTRITSSAECQRKAWLEERVAEPGGGNDKAVKGTLTHGLIQAALAQGLRTAPQMHAEAERIVADSTDMLYQVELSEEAAMQCLKEAVPGIQRWMHRFLRAEPATDAVLGAGYDAAGRDVRRRVAVQEVVDIEESIWSTKFGVKGMIDVSTQLVLDELGQPQQQQEQQQQRANWMQAAGAGGPGSGGSAGAGAAPGRQVSVAPVEIKTGKLHESHRAQVLLYLLLMEERYGRPLDWGMLWYTHQPDPLLVMKKPAELACLLAVRNRLAAAVAHGELPPLSDDKRGCNWCFQQANCTVAHRAALGAERGSVDSFVRQSTDAGGRALDTWQQELGGRYERTVGHMTQADCDFLRKWDELVTLEERFSGRRRPEIWAMAGGERQAAGRCVAGLAMAHADDAGRLYTFCRPDDGPLDCAFADGEMLLLSVEGEHVAVARGYFYTASATRLTVSLNKPLRPGLLWPRGPPADAAAAAAGCEAGVRWRLDRDEVSSTFTRLRGNLYTLFRREFEERWDPQAKQRLVGPELAESQRAERLRRLVVSLEAPQWEAPDPTQPDPTPAGMNSEQAVAVRRVLQARDYALVLGMPGAGKTTTIVSMVQALVAQGRSVLLSSYTNSAVDNILMKLAREEVPFLRLGREAGVHPAVRPWLPGGERYPQRTTREWARLAESVPVFGATCFGMSHALLRGKQFDVCIIDEAGQMTLPASLGPLLKARAFVLVGDHNQLPPLVACREAEEGGLGDSLFKRLSDAHPGAVVALPVQYRMAADIQALPNALIYGDALRCGTDDVAQGTLELPAGAAALLPGLAPWLQAALDPQRRVLFLDTAGVEGAREAETNGDSGSNAGEAALVLAFLRAATAAGLPGEALGVISPYRAQVAALERGVRGARLAGVEVLTVDKCQGRDKDCVVLSLVKSNGAREAGKLLADWRRINVAITRARKKLVLVGDAATLASLPLFERLVGLVRQRGWYLQLPPDAVQAAAGAAPA